MRGFTSKLEIEMRVFLLALGALLWSGTVLAEDLPSSAGAPRVPFSASVPLPSEARPMISQGDPAVRSVRLGNTTVGRSGCLAMSLYDALMKLNQLSADTAPAAFVRMLSSYGLFTNKGLLRWNLGALFPVWVERKDAIGMSALTSAQAALSSGAQVLLEVATRHGTFHWVVLTRVADGDAEIRDPNGGRIGWLSSLYGVNSVHGYAAIMAQ